MLLIVYYGLGMSEVHSIEYYLSLIESAASYHDLAIFRARFFSLLSSSLSKEDYLKIKDAWTAKAKDESLPVAPDRSQPADPKETPLNPTVPEAT